MNVVVVVAAAMQGGAGDKHFLASADLAEWHFVALTFNASTAAACVYVDGQGTCGRATGEVLVPSIVLIRAQHRDRSCPCMLTTRRC